MRKVVESVELFETYFNIIKDVYARPTANILNREMLKAIPLKSRMTQGFQLYLLYLQVLNIVPENLAKALRKEKEIKEIWKVGERSHIIPI